MRASTVTVCDCCCDTSQPCLEASSDCCATHLAVADLIDWLKEQQYCFHLLSRLTAVLGVLIYRCTAPSNSSSSCQPLSLRCKKLHSRCLLTAAWCLTDISTVSTCRHVSPPLCHTSASSEPEMGVIISYRSYTSQKIYFSLHVNVLYE